MNTNLPLNEERAFEDAMSRLEALVSQLETEDIGLEQAIKFYQEGVTLARRCLDQLSAAELRVQELSLEFNTPVQE